MIEPIDPLKSRVLDIVHVTPPPTSTHHFGLAHPDDRPRKSVALGVPAAADRPDEPTFREPLGVADRQILHPTIAMMNQLAALWPCMQSLLERIEGNVASQRLRHAPA